LLTNTLLKKGTDVTISAAKKQWDNRNTGALFHNENKADEKDRDYNGSLDVEGVEYWVSGFVRTSKAGKKFLSLKVKPKQEPKPAPKPVKYGADFAI
jgi:hypothetical protein